MLVYFILKFNIIKNIIQLETYQTNADYINF